MVCCARERKKAFRQGTSWSRLWKNIPFMSLDRQRLNVDVVVVVVVVVDGGVDVVVVIVDGVDILIVG